MAAKGKSINLFLMDNKADGRIKCTLANWTGVSYKIPRVDLDKCKDRKDLKQTGVYFLFGTDETTDHTYVYIGQAGVRKNKEGILTRLQEHKINPKEDYWTDAVVFTTSNNSFGPTEISYLENRFCSLAKDAGRYILKNANEPTRGNITEEKEAELEEFIDYALVVIGTLGYKVFVPVSGESGPGEVKTVYYFQTKNIDAKGIITSDGFAVLKGSTVSEKTAPKCPETIRKLRSKHLEKIKDGLLAEDVLFSSPSAAAGFVGGYSVNGQTAWKTAEGVSLKDMGN